MSGQDAKTEQLGAGASMQLHGMQGVLALIQAWALKRYCIFPRLHGLKSLVEGSKAIGQHWQQYIAGPLTHGMLTTRTRHAAAKSGMHTNYMPPQQRQVHTTLAMPAP